MDGIGKKVDISHDFSIQSEKTPLLDSSQKTSAVGQEALHELGNNYLTMGTAIVGTALVISSIVAFILFAPYLAAGLAATGGLLLTAAAISHLASEHFGQEHVEPQTSDNLPQMAALLGDIVRSEPFKGHEVQDAKVEGSTLHATLVPKKHLSAEEELQEISKEMDQVINSSPNKTQYLKLFMTSVKHPLMKLDAYNALKSIGFNVKLPGLIATGLKEEKEDFKQMVNKLSPKNRLVLEKCVLTIDQVYTDKNEATKHLMDILFKNVTHDKEELTNAIHFLLLNHQEIFSK